MDAKNTPVQHGIVAVFTGLLVSLFYFVLGSELTTALARTAFILLFLVLVVGPVTKLKRPSGISSPLSLPWSWRGELGIWFALTALVHFILHWVETPLSQLIRIGGSGFSLANVLGLVALFWTLVLASTSLQKTIIFIGTESWKWLHTMTYVVFYLVLAHFAYFQFFSTRGEVGPDWFGYMALVMGVIVIFLQISAFVAVTKQRKTNSQSL